MSPHSSRPPPPPSGPFYRVVLVRANGTEQTLQEFPYTDFPDEQAKRAQAAAFARSRRDAGEHVRIYSSDQTGKISAGDLVADSDVNV